MRSEVTEETEEQPSETERPVYTLEEIEAAEFTGVIDGPGPVIPEEVLSGAEEDPVDFARLREINPELYAWIRVPGTVIDYPVAQHEGDEQEYYLHHDLYGDPQFVGCVFSQVPNAKDFSDPVTVLYGHNMKNGSMFAELHSFLDPAAFEDGPRYVYIYTENATFIYEIYSAYPADNRNILLNYDFADEAVLEEYVDSTIHPRSMEAVVNDEVAVTAEDKILTLSTCIGGMPNQRLLVQAVLIYKK